MKIIEITDKKIEKMSSLVEDMLEAGGKLMLCLEKLANDDMFGERSSERNRYRREGEMTGDRRYMGMRGHDDWEDDEMWGERRSTRRMR